MSISNVYKPADVNKLPEIPGVYLFRDMNKKILYIGKAKNLKKRVSSYFHQKTLPGIKNRLIKLIYDVNIITVGSEFEALLLEARLIRDNQPKYNVIWKDDKHYIYIKITSEEYPRILFSRLDKDKKSFYVGPFPSSSTVREILKFVRTIFPYCNQNRNIAKRCFYSHIGLCDPCPADIKIMPESPKKWKKEIYRKNIQNIKILLSSRIRKVKSFLEKEMVMAAKEENFEKAAAFRSKIENLEYLLNYHYQTDLFLENPSLFHLKQKEEMRELSKILKNYFPDIRLIRKIECYDISHISGKLATGSMITFTNGIPDKNYYRRFRIRLKNEPNDFAMLSEVMERRLNHHDWTFPDLFIIDGGAPQLIALKKIYDKIGLKIPYIGIAKEKEELVIPGRMTFTKIKLPANSPALHVILRLRDESHRFAHKYHEHLRLKNLVNSHPVAH